MLANIQRPTIEFDDEVTYSTLSVLDMLQGHCHAASFNRGWWHDPITKASLIPNVPGWDGEPEGEYTTGIIRAWFPFVIATKIALIHSEASEGLEAYRSDLTDDKIPFPGIVAEMADVVIRVFDLIGCLQWYEAGRTTGEVPEMIEAYSLGRAILAKIPFNAGRADHGFIGRAKKF